jgi:hypothetical protein
MSLNMTAAPDSGWLAFLKMAFGFTLLIILGSLSYIIAIEKVHADSSYGLDIILGGLLTLSGGFVGWAFREKTDPAQLKDRLSGKPIDEPQAK